MRVLVTYASKCGSTREIAQHVGHILETAGFTVEVAWAGQPYDLEKYDAVVLGSAIRIGKLLPEALRFVQQHQQRLNEIPFACFAVCMTMQEDTLENRQIAVDYLAPLRELAEPVSIGLFAGVIAPWKMNLIEKLIVKLVRVPEGDHRDWAAIRAWAEQLIPLLQGQEELYAPLPA